MPRCLEKNPCKTCWKDWSCLPKNLGVLGRMSGPIVQSCSVWKFHQDTASGISEIDRNPKPRKGSVKFIPFELQMFNAKLVASCTEIMTWHSIEATSMAHGRFFTKELALKKCHVATLPRHKFLHSPLRLCQRVRFFQGESFRANSPASYPWHRDIRSSRRPGRTRHPTVGEVFLVSSPDGSPTSGF